jgi:hypothetical protein
MSNQNTSSSSSSSIEFSASSTSQGSSSESQVADTSSIANTLVSPRVFIESSHSLFAKDIPGRGSYHSGTVIHLSNRYERLSSFDFNDSKSNIKLVVKFIRNKVPSKIYYQELLKGVIQPRELTSLFQDVDVCEYVIGFGPIYPYFSREAVKERKEIVDYDVEVGDVVSELKKQMISDWVGSKKFKIADLGVLYNILPAKLIAVILDYDPNDTSKEAKSNKRSGIKRVLSNKNFHYDPDVYRREYVEKISSMYKRKKPRKELLASLKTLGPLVSSLNYVKFGKEIRTLWLEKCFGRPILNDRVGVDGKFGYVDCSEYSLLEISKMFVKEIKRVRNKTVIIYMNKLPDTMYRKPNSTSELKGKKNVCVALSLSLMKKKIHVVVIAPALTMTRVSSTIKGVYVKKVELLCVKQSLYALHLVYRKEIVSKSDKKLLAFSSDDQIKNLWINYAQNKYQLMTTLFQIRDSEVDTLDLLRKRGVKINQPRMRDRKHRGENEISSDYYTSEESLDEFIFSSEDLEKEVIADPRRKRHSYSEVSTTTTSEEILLSKEKSSSSEEDPLINFLMDEVEEIRLAALLETNAGEEEPPF